MTDLDLEQAARRLFWWKEPAAALADPTRFLAQVMVYGTPEDLAVAQQHFPESAFRQVLADPPPGLFDPRSWAYWHAVFGLATPGPPPGRRFPADRGHAITS
ncbi:MAG TPA: hypothetical protein VFE33_13505 [Thermoanaerobaculia bacterium]|nr:hypothetical protein [Thermoanaerobaculia bacterium]